MIKKTFGDNVTLYNADCLDVMREMEAGSVDAVITDPPYGVNINKYSRIQVSRGSSNESWDKERLPEHVSYIHDYFSAIKIIWGGNYYADLLEPTRGWLIWDKLNDGRTFGEAELAWTNIDTVIRRYKKFPINMDGGKEHPTQKPIELMKWCIALCKLPLDAVIFDPFMGSGTTLVSALQVGHTNLIGIERDPKYFEIACKRIHDALQQPTLWSVK